MALRHFFSDSLIDSTTAQPQCLHAASHRDWFTRSNTVGQTGSTHCMAVSQLSLPFTKHL